VVFDEFVFPFSTSTTISTPELDLYSLFPTDAVVAPPLQLSPAGTTAPCPSLGPCPSSSAASDTLGPAPCPGMEGSPFGTTPITAPAMGPGPSTLAPPTRFA
jgi:hypothetical protein